MSAVSGQRSEVRGIRTTGGAGHRWLYLPVLGAGNPIQILYKSWKSNSDPLSGPASCCLLRHVCCDKDRRKTESESSGNSQRIEVHAENEEGPGFEQNLLT